MTMTAQDFLLYQGETKTIEIPILGQDSATPFTMTTVTEVDWGAWNTAESRVLTKKLSLSGTSAITIFSLNGTDDAIRFTLTESDTDDFPAGTYNHECRITDASGAQEVVFVGVMTVSASRTVTV